MDTAAGDSAQIKARILKYSCGKPEGSIVILKHGWKIVLRFVDFEYSVWVDISGHEILKTAHIQAIWLRAF